MRHTRKLLSQVVLKVHRTIREPLCSDRINCPLLRQAPKDDVVGVLNGIPNQCAFRQCVPGQGGHAHGVNLNLDMGEILVQ